MQRHQSFIDVLRQSAVSDRHTFEPHKLLGIRELELLCPGPEVRPDLEARLLGAQKLRLGFVLLRSTELSRLLFLQKEQRMRDRARLEEADRAVLEAGRPMPRPCAPAAARAGGRCIAQSRPPPFF